MNIDFGRVLHPRFDEIEAFAFGLESADDRAPIAAHLRGCARCQDRLRGLRRLREAVIAAEVPPMSVKLRTRILTRARAGDEGILPAFPSEPLVVRGTKWRRAMGVMAAAMLAGVVLLVPHRGLDAVAAAGTLSIEQRAATPAPALHVQYRPAGMLDGERQVVLRATTYGSKGPWTATEERFTLERGDDGAFVGDVTLPVGTVFARYVVASPAGDHVDDNDARGWEGAMRDSASRPSFDGLMTQMNLNFFRWELQAQAAHDMLRYYPERPLSVRLSLKHDADLAGAAGADSVRRAYRPRVSEMQRSLASAAVSPTEMWEMAMLGMGMRDSAMVAHWRRRMMAEYPNDGGTVQQRVFAVSEGLPDDQILHELERIWKETGGQSIQLLANAFSAASRMNDVSAIERWGERLIAFGGPYGGMAAEKYVTIPKLRARGEVLLRATLHARPSVPSVEWQGSLERTTRSSIPTARQSEFLLLGTALLADGRIAGAQDTLRRAAALAWNAPLLRRLGDAELAGGDTTAATIAYAWAAADPSTPSALADTLRGAIGAARRGAWDAALRNGRATLRAITARASIRRPFDARARFTASDGREQAIAAALGRGVAVVAFVDRGCAPSLADLPSLDSVTTRLAAVGVPVVILVENTAGSTIVSDLGRRGFHRPIGFDDRGLVSRAMRQAGTPHYFVVERGQVIRFDARKANELVLLVDAVQRGN